MIQVSTLRRAVFASSLVALAACGGSSNSTSGSETTVALDTTNTTVAAETTTTVVVVVVNPLTGEPASDATTLSRPALVVKIDNHPSAHPQAGINQADIIFEENVEKLTRFAAVFQSQGSDPVGPIRSGRFQDINMLGSLNKPLFVWSGGNAKVTAAIRKSDLVDLSYTIANKDGGYRRDNDRNPPYDLVAETSKLWTLAPDGSGPPPAQFVYRGANDAMPTGVQKVDGVKVSMDGVKVHWLWNPTNSTFDRFQNGKPHVDVADVQLNVRNVVVLEVEYTKSYSPTSKTLGGGKVTVFTNGVAIAGTWTRADRLLPFTLKDSSASVIKLTPGRTSTKYLAVDSPWASA